MVKRPSASDVIASLDLKPHPEGGHYRETFRDSAVDAVGRSRSTAIYFLLGRGERSHWHRIDAVEVWHYYAGDALTLRIADHDGTRSITLGPDISSGEVPQARSCRPMPGRQQKAPVTGRWSAARLRRDSISQRSNWRQRIGSRNRISQRLRNMSFAAINPPTAISTAATAMLVLALAKPARIRNAVESSGVAYDAAPNTLISPRFMPISQV